MMRRAAMLMVALACIVALVPRVAMAGDVRVKDVTEIEGMRANQLIGYGLVVGLSGTGDSLRNAPFTRQAMTSMLDNLGVNVRDADPRVQNVAAVIVTADAPPFIRPGSRIDVTVSSLGDAASLRGGTLVMTALLGADGVVYAAAQGALVGAGVAAQGDAQAVTDGVPTVARIPGGAIVERPMPGTLAGLERLNLVLANPDFGTSTAMAAAINTMTQVRWGMAAAKATDHRTIALTRPRSVAAPEFLAAIGDVRMTPDGPAKVVIDERTGTVVIGENVRISRVAITHGGISIRVSELPQVVQPNPFANGETAVQPMTDIAVSEAGDQLGIVAGPDLDTLVSGLNRLGIKPKGTIAILQALRSAGALQAELVIQ